MFGGLFKQSPTFDVAGAIAQDAAYNRGDFSNVFGGVKHSGTGNGTTTAYLSPMQQTAVDAFQANRLKGWDAVGGALERLGTEEVDNSDKIYERALALRQPQIDNQRNRLVSMGIPPGSRMSDQSEQQIGRNLNDLALGAVQSSDDNYSRNLASALSGFGALSNATLATTPMGGPARAVGVTQAQQMGQAADIARVTQHNQAMSGLLSAGASLAGGLAGGFF